MSIKLHPRARPGITPYRCDLTSDADIAGMFEWIEANPELGKVDVCIPNAGLAASSSLLEGTQACLLTGKPATVTYAVIKSGHPCTCTIV